MRGLTDEQVNERINNKQYNYDVTVVTKSVGQIFITNICTLFNFINVFLGLLILMVGSYKNLLFLGTILCNTAIGIIQEMRAKRTIDRLSLISEKMATVIRNDKYKKININDIVIDDIIVYEVGNQISCDTVIIEGMVEVNESLITGEIDPIKKKKGDILLSGSFVVSGSVVGRVIHVNVSNYTSQITLSAKYLKPIGSEIMRSMKQIIKVISYLIIPLGIIFFCKQYFLVNNSLDGAVVNTVAAIIAVIPDGLVLLTSTVMAISVIKLSKHNVLVQELYCIENLARVDTICFDKTGTLTTGMMHVSKFVKLKNFDFNIIEEINYNLDNHNPTMDALVKEYGKNNSLLIDKIVPFSSERKWSGVSFINHGTYVIGALDFLFKDETLAQYNKNFRVVALARSSKSFINDSLPNDLELLGFFLIEDELRMEAKQMISFLEKNGVDVKIISGDNPSTVSEIATKLDLNFKDSYIDTTGLGDDDLENLVDKYHIFGRVTPQGKHFLIKALQKNGHTVAMVGDGVNDVLALRQADCGIALASGTDAARNVSEFVLLNSNFDSIPKIIKEGRRTINNIERSASLFITKTLYSLMLLALFLFVNIAYPFIPIQLTLTSVFTIGIPAFILALEPNEERVKGRFLLNVIGVAFPSSLTIVFNIVLLLIVDSMVDLSVESVATLGIILIATTGFMHMYYISKPLNVLRGTLLISMIISFLVSAVGFRRLFSLSLINKQIIVIYLLLLLFSYLFFNIITKIFDLFIYKRGSR
ncbi:MAG: HAD-IC family P-type ATPase [Bacilli bacterium]|nr:HAD-IC family P-type ATPase [Bacilli bacterium]